MKTLTRLLGFLVLLLGVFIVGATTAQDTTEEKDPPSRPKFHTPAYLAPETNIA